MKSDGTRIRFQVILVLDLLCSQIHSSIPAGTEYIFFLVNYIRYVHKRIFGTVVRWLRWSIVTVHVINKYANLVEVVW
jgi:hypothetical protein